MTGQRLSLLVKIHSELLQHVMVLAPFLLFAFAIALTLCVLYTRFWFVMVVYFSFIAFDNAPSTGSRKLPFAGWRHAIVRSMASYFPWKLIITDNTLNPENGPYLFVCHPHGLWGFGAWMGLGCAEFMDMFPEIDVYIGTLNISFIIPFIREFLLFAGFMPVNRESIQTILAGGSNRAAAIVVGGARESLLMRPRTNRIILRKRKGFIKLALRAGAQIVPVYSFGETNTYKTYTNSVVQVFQDQVAKMFGFTIPLFYGKFMIFPNRAPMWTVVGKPLSVTKEINPSKEQIDDLHAQYINALEELYETYKDTYDIDREEGLEIVE